MKTAIHLFFILLLTSTAYKAQRLTLNLSHSLTKCFGNVDYVYTQKSIPSPITLGFCSEIAYIHDGQRFPYFYWIGLGINTSFHKTTNLNYRYSASANYPTGGIAEISTSTFTSEITLKMAFQFDSETNLNFLAGTEVGAIFYLNQLSELDPSSNINLNTLEIDGKQSTSGNGNQFALNAAILKLFGGISYKTEIVYFLGTLGFGLTPGLLTGNIPASASFQRFGIFMNAGIAIPLARFGDEAD